ncbi:MAG: hypothetical protein A2166_03795 [Omnitrophica WOR_2 bacterium RBG_13_41_10]|nr:MAG: hypothetical protein A2166_03795 [Omnitrophica WOR_2 bacterium RBG_13_41_10]
MTGGKKTPREDRRGIKICGGQKVETGKIIGRSMSLYKAGKNVSGINTLFALCDGTIYFSKKKTSHGRVRTYINIMPAKKA